MHESPRTDGSTITYLTCAETAKLLRANLKATFPGTRFSVRSHTYAGGASINVGWTDGPFEDDVRKVTENYRGASFDGMIDLKSYHDSMVHFEGEEMPRTVHHGADYVFTDREVSPELAARLEPIAEAVLQRNSDYATDKLHDRYIDYVWTPFGTFQGGNGYAFTRYLGMHLTTAMLDEAETHPAGVVAGLEALRDG